jgi:O-antigen/teichoic acid export membrane protein
LQRETAKSSVSKNASYIFFIKLFPALSLVAANILYPRELSKVDYGIYYSFWVKLLLLGTFAYIGLPALIITWSASSVKHFYLQLNSRHFFLSICWMLVLSLIFYLLQMRSQPLSFFVVSGLLLMYAVHSIQESLLISAQKMRSLLLVNLLFAVYFLLAHILMLQNYSLTTLLVYLLIGMVVRAMILSFECYRVYGDVPVARDPVLDNAKARNLWMHLGFYDLLQTVFRWIDKFVISLFIAAPLAAIYYNGAQEIPLLSYLLGAVSSSVLLQLASAKSISNELKYLPMRESGKFLASIVFPLFFFLLLFSKELFSVVFTDKYLPAVPIFIVSIMVLPLRAYNYTNILQHLHRGALINKGAIMDLIIALLLMYPLFKVFGLPGVALAFVVSTYIQVAYYLYHTSRLLGTPVTDLLPLKNWVAKFIGFGVLFYVLHEVLSNLDSEYTLLIGGVAGILISLGQCLLELWHRKRQVR